MSDQNLCILEWCEVGELNWGFSYQDSLGLFVNHNQLEKEFSLSVELRVTYIKISFSLRLNQFIFKGLEPNQNMFRAIVQ